MSLYEIERPKFTEPVTVTCHAMVRKPIVNDAASLDFEECGQTDTLTPKQRSDPRCGGKWCDGRGYGNRHPVAVMTGPKGKAYE